jgi:cbb3-type cytochrome oxidase subunit 3
MRNKFQRTVIALWPVALLIAVVVFPLEVYHVYRKQNREI